MQDGSYEDHPIDHIEPQRIEEFNDAVKDAELKARRRQLWLMNKAFDFIERSADKTTATWQVAFALGLGCVEGKKMTDVAMLCGVTKACISKGAREFCEISGLPPSFYMKSQEAVKAYKKTRESQLT